MSTTCHNMYLWRTRHKTNDISIHSKGSEFVIAFSWLAADL